ncbi:hypothetical protein V1514DRAFT_130427 [Lipomyces japonicus]|uniref:uncharacterized protein n=1 Tax=Lipomyces japonicus TaxID=56871 RepID=UPI0034CFE8B4
MSSKAVPLSISTKNIKATFRQNKTISSATDDILKAQGLSWAVRTALTYANITLKAKLYTEDDIEHYDVDQIITGGISSEERRILDGVEREKLNAVFGPVVSYANRLTLEEVGKIHEFLSKGWDESTQENGVIFAFARGDPSKKNGYEWESYQAIGFAEIVIDEDGNKERKYVSRLYFTSPSLNEPLLKTLVYDFEREGI